MKRLSVTCLGIFLFLGTFSVVGATDLMYSDEKPHYQHVRTLDLSHRQIWDDASIHKEIVSARLQQSTRTVEQILKDQHFLHLSGCYSCDQNKLLQIYGRISSGKLRECVAVETQYSRDSLFPDFQSKQICLPTVTEPEKLWHIGKNKLQGLPYIHTSFTESSWNFVHLSLRWMHRDVKSYASFRSPEQQIFCERLYRRIRSKGLENTFMRVVVVVNQDHQYGFHALYNTPEEKERTCHFLHSFLRS